MKRGLMLFWLILILPFTMPASQPVDWNEMDDYIRLWVKDSGLTGLALSVVKDQEVVFTRAYGYADRSGKKALTPDALFNIASCTKAMTAAVAASLVREGRMNWSDKVTDYVTGFQLADPCVTQALEIEDILCHRSGLSTFSGDLLWYETNYSAREIVYRMRFIPLKNRFRVDYGYQNNMYLLAGEIMGVVAGQSWSRLIYDRIFTPLGMEESRVCGLDIMDGQNVAYPHYRQKRLKISMERPNPAGSVFSSVEEMTRWIRMLLNEGVWEGRQVLHPEAIKEMWTPRTLMNVTSFWESRTVNFRSYGLGWILYDYSGSKIVDHGGGMPGYISKVTLVPDQGLGLVILTNDMNYVADGLKYKILDLYLNDGETDWVRDFASFYKNNETIEKQKRAQRSAQRVRKTRPTRKPKDYTGLYEDRMYGQAVVELADDTLFLTLIPARKVFVSEMRHWHYDTFRIRFMDEFLPEGFVSFRLNSSGRVSGFSIDLPNADLHFSDLDFERVEAQ